MSWNVTADQRSIKKYMPYLLATAIFMQMLDATILNTALPAIAKDLNESALNMQSAIVSYALTLAIFIPISGYLADKFGTKKVFIVSIFVFSLGSLFCALSGSLIQLDISRVVQGMGGALMTPVARLAMIKTYPKNELVGAMNYAIIPALIGPILGPLVGGYLVEIMSWHWIFLINIPMGLLGILFSLKYMPDYSLKSSRLDVVGFLIFGVSSILLSIALELTGHSENYILESILMFLGVFMMVFYYLYAKKAKNPIFPLGLFLIRTFRVGVIGNLITRLGIGSIPLLVPLLIQLAYGQSPSISGWIIAPMALAAMFTKPFVIPIINRFGYRNILIFNTIILGILIGSLSIPSEKMPIYWFIPVMLIIGCLNSIQFTAMNSITVANLRDNQTSSGNSLISVNQQLAIGFGIAMGLSILKFAENTEWISHNNIHTAFQYTFIFLGVFTVLSSMIFRWLHPKDGNNLKSKK
ncbi:DHA2 family efflux MFS transporter permease subunit [Neisseria montereyensis]|uniref:DHA2 family efflux MFS transporter permease subunit n=1 Tax=Neisseria montereyensis TaxID=2973938 RepID=A0ABT2FB07_9NEIS|nr:DHA2 family efflux MFS transporter permease subunit [Neisseria montereyensis]MCS4532698.1 DHA2 family efflux MFS transporter permease subunit [Neisseria montereyensis]